MTLVEIAGKLEEAVGESDWNEAKSALNDLWDIAEEAKPAKPEPDDVVIIFDPQTMEWYPRRFEVYSAYDMRCIAKGELKELVLMRAAEVKRRIEEAGE